MKHLNANKIIKGNTDLSLEEQNRERLFKIQDKLIKYFEDLLDSKAISHKELGYLLKFLEMNDVRAITEMVETLNETKDASLRTEAFKKVLKDLPINPWEERNNA